MMFIRQGATARKLSGTYFQKYKNDHELNEFHELAAPLIVKDYSYLYSEKQISTNEQKIILFGNELQKICV